ncbi:MAG: ABC transporter permease [Spirochaetaceae bacterium]|jgi:ABC-2 type transport system permease protein|nr:ABC transporter permease [Spirochaetaceae bacterium]
MRERFKRLRGSAAQAAALFRKEVFSYSISPAFFGIAIFFLLFTAVWLFNLQGFFQRDQASLRLYFSAFPIAFILVIPALTMRSWAEERKLGSIELLLTLPFSEWALVLGKFFAALGALAAVLVLSVATPLSLSPLGRFDAGVIFTEYVGALLLASSAVSLGLLLSALSKNQVAAFLGGVAVLLAVMLCDQIPWTAALPGALNDALKYASLSFHFQSFSKGVLDSRDLAYFLVTTFAFLFLNTRVLLLRKWS